MIQKSVHGAAGRHANKTKSQQFIADIQPVVAELQNSGVLTNADIALELQLQGIRKPRGGHIWTAGDVTKLLRKIRSSNGA